jgi:hypothetical protein
MASRAFASARCGVPFGGPIGGRMGATTGATLGGQGGENVLTTFSSYGDVAGDRQAEIIRGLGAGEGRASG